ncbi:MAG TPA: glutamate racemase [Flavobacteriales bacterium]|jgi:glutamate racemase|nr:glutamate racemase [Flavobacteriales bacterium]HAW19819.1 glutamate racemase [Flavobacteriales bacterium]
MNEQPIGIFDSGVGGLTIWSTIQTLLSAESTLYLADSQNAPYGAKSKSQILDLSIKNTEILIDRGAKIIVVACNTATTNSIDSLRSQYDIPFIGIEPATKPAAIATKSRKIGILATKGTFASELFLNTSRNYRGEVEIIETIGTGLVDIVESGNLEAARPLLETYLTPMIEAGVDNIVLGCTHYPMLTSIIKSIVGDEIRIIDSGQAVARQTKAVIEEHGLESSGSNPSFHFVTNTNQDVLNQFVKTVSNVSFTTEKTAF